jgi:hypothetical protein
MWTTTRKARRKTMATPVIWRTHRHHRERTVGHGHPLGQHGFLRYHGGQACTCHQGC